MKRILITEKQLNFLVEQNEINVYQRKGDPYEYKYENDKWFGRRKGTEKWIDISKYQKSVDILNTEKKNGTLIVKKESDDSAPTNTQNTNSNAVGDVGSKEFNDKLENVAKNLGFKKEWLIKIMKKESRLNPSIVNNIGCVGLIQFCPDKKRGDYKTIGGKKYNLSDIKNMSAAEQLTLVEEYFKPYAERINSYFDLYIFTFYPRAMGKPKDYVIGSEVSNEYAQKLSRQNPAVARAAGKNPGEPLTVSDFEEFAMS